MMFGPRTPLFDIQSRNIADLTVAGGGDSIYIHVTDAGTPAVYSAPAVTGNGEVTITVNSLQPGYRLNVTSRLVPAPEAVVMLTEFRPYADSTSVQGDAPEPYKSYPAGTKFVLRFTVKDGNGSGVVFIDNFGITTDAMQPFDLYRNGQLIASSPKEADPDSSVGFTYRYATNTDMQDGEYEARFTFAVAGELHYTYRYSLAPVGGF